MKSILIVVLILTQYPLAVSQTTELRKKHFNTERALALEGYDPVSYFEGSPEEGSEKISFVHDGITYHFKSQTSLNKFKASPQKYEPAYGGWCAYAMGETGEKVKVDPETYKIIDGKLYLFYNFWGNNTLEDWNEREQKLKSQADKNWASTIR